MTIKQMFTDRHIQITDAKLQLKKESDAREMLSPEVNIVGNIINDLMYKHLRLLILDKTTWETGRKSRMRNGTSVSEKGFKRNTR